MEGVIINYDTCVEESVPREYFGICSSCRLDSYGGYRTYWWMVGVCYEKYGVRFLNITPASLQFFLSVYFLGRAQLEFLGIYSIGVKLLLELLM